MVHQFEEHDPRAADGPMPAHRCTSRHLRPEELVGIPEPQHVEHDAAIQRCEYTVEAVWKAAQRYLAEVEGIVVGSPKSCVPSSREVGLLDDGAAACALEMIDDRNETVHTYNEAVARAIHGRLGGHAAPLRRWAEAMRARLGG